MSNPYMPTDLRKPVPTENPYVQPKPQVHISEPQPQRQVTQPAPQPAAQPVEEASVSDALATEANPPEFPPGAPKLVPLMRLRYRERGKWLRKLAPIEAQFAKLPDKGTQVDAEGAADMYELMGEIDDLLYEVAVDKNAYQEWVVNATDAEFMQLFMAYIARTQPGESASSAS